MKITTLKIAVLLALQFFFTKLFSQSVAINTDKSQPNASAILDVKSTNKGLLIPRMNSSQRGLIGTPATGLLVYDTDTNSYWYYNGTAWTNLLNPAGTGWSITGNAAINGATNFIGTTNSAPLRFRANNLWGGEINAANGTVSLGLGAGEANTIGQGNIAIGLASLNNNLSSNHNVAIGDSSLYTQDGSVGGTNTAVGTHTLFSSTTSLANTAIGGFALFKNVDGGYNTAIGLNSLSNNISGDSNTAVGTRALQFNTASYNTATGASSLRFNSTGTANTATGFQAASGNTSGSRNTSTGYFSLSTNSTGQTNTAVGSEAMFDNTTGSSNTALGVFALLGNTTGDENTAIGMYALRTQSFSNGGTAWVSGNVAVGFNALTNNNPTTSNNGVHNTALGHSSLGYNTTGFENTATGFEALYFNGTGFQNTANGYKALNVNSSGFGNTSVGFESLISNSNGTYNTAIGWNALSFNTTGSFNTAIGIQALDKLVGGSHNIAIGDGAGTSNGSPNVTNTISIGNYGYPNAASNQAFIGNLSTGWTGGNTPWYTFSDGRMKNNVAADVKGLDFIMRLKPVTYNRSIKNIVQLTGEKDTDDFAGKYDVEKRKESGFIAQEVEVAAKDAGYDFSGVGRPAKSTQLYTLSYEQFVVPLVKGMQEQQAIIIAQQKQIDLLIKRIEVLENK